jgi:hypothetical protein
MKRWLPILIAFLVGAVVASVGWGWYLLRFQVDMVATHTSALTGEADIGRQILSYLDSPDALKARRLEFAASNMVACLPGDIDYWDREFPYMRLKMRWRPSLEKAETFMRERQVRVSTNSLGGDHK